MSIAKRWTVDIQLTEESDEGVIRTHAEARLNAEEPTDLRGLGHARKHPDDADVPQIGDELAAARALADLAHQLLLVAADDIENVTGEPVVSLVE